MGRGKRAPSTGTRPQPVGSTFVPVVDPQVQMPPELYGALDDAVARRLAALEGLRKDGRYHPPLPSAAEVYTDVEREVVRVLERVGTAGVKDAVALVEARFADAGIELLSCELTDNRYHTEDLATVYVQVAYDDLGEAWRVVRSLDAELDPEEVSVMVQQDIERADYQARIAVIRAAEKEPWRGYEFRGARHVRAASDDELHADYHFHIVKGFDNEALAEAWAQESAAENSFIYLREVVSDHDINMQVQYLSRYLTGMAETDLSQGLRVDLSEYESGGNYHAVKIHQDDAAEFARRVKEHRQSLGAPV
jgi:hypothetical protein